MKRRLFRFVALIALLVESLFVVGCQSTGTRMVVAHPYLEVREAMQKLRANIQSEPSTNSPPRHPPVWVQPIHDISDTSCELHVTESIASASGHTTTLQAQALDRHTTKVVVRSIERPYLAGSADWMSEQPRPDVERERLFKLNQLLEPSH